MPRRRASLGLVNRVVEEERRCSPRRARSRASVARSRRLRSPPRAACCAGIRGAILARIDEEARIFGAQLQSEEFRTAVSAFLGRAKAR